MKYLKKVLFIILYIICAVICLFIIDYFRLFISYKIQENHLISEFDVQGNKNHYVPQGLAYSDKYNLVLQTSYNGKHDVSMLYITDLSNNYIKKLKLKELDNTNNLNHVGGIATDNKTVWITSDYEVNEYLLEDIISTDNNYIQSIKNTKLPIRGDFCYYKDNYLWIGDFFLNPFYKVPNNNPLLLRYDSNDIDYSNPNLIISLPKMVQGMSINDNGEFIFTRSFTPFIHSDLVYYKNILEDKADTYKFNNKKIPYYRFNNRNKIKNIKLPPMAEGIFYKDKKLYILFENSSDHYFYALPKMDKVVSYKK